jgi:hypothetical protein
MGLRLVAELTMVLSYSRTYLLGLNINFNYIKMKSIYFFTIATIVIFQLLLFLAVMSLLIEMYIHRF